MAYIIKMPKLGMGMNEGTLLEWFVAPGDEVTEGDVIAEIESEKTVAEIAASEDGVFRLVYVSAGETVDPGAALGIVAEQNEDIGSLKAKIDRDPVEPREETPAASAPTVGGDADTVAASSSETRQVDRIRASPKAKKRANELDVPLADVEGSGPEGAIVLSDVEAAAAASESASAVGEAGDETEPRAHGGASIEATPKARRRARRLDVDLESVNGSGRNGAVTASDLPTEDGTVDVTGSSVVGPGEPATLTPLEERELDGMRQTIATRLGESYHEAVHVTVHRRIDMEEVLAATKVIDEYVDADATVTDVVLVALSATLDEHPEFNARFEDGIHRIYDQQNVGIAVDIDKGLITPVLSGVGNRSLDELARGRREITDRALSGDYSTADLSGGTFTISNLGVLGIDSFTPIINPPEVAILGVDSITERPVRGDDGVEFHRFGGFDLSFDHRVVDGADAARFLDTLATNLTEPWSVLLDRA